MPDTYTQIITQLVFAVEGRQSLIALLIRKRSTNTSPAL